MIRIPMIFNLKEISLGFFDERMKWFDPNYTLIGFFNSFLDDVYLICSAFQMVDGEDIFL